MTRLHARIMTFTLGAATLMSSGFLFADSDLPLDRNTQTASAKVAATDDCAKELLLSYYPPEFVQESLKKFGVPQDKWPAIINGLKQKDKDVIRLVEEKASQINPNPLKDPQQRQVAIKIFKETLFEVFASVLTPLGISDEKTIQAILDDVQQQKAKRFAQCVEKRQISLPGAPKQEPVAPAPAPAPAAPAAPVAPSSAE